MTIDPRLHRIVAAQPYPLLFATISGAHLYGFPSPDSDFDLRGAHILPLEEIVGLDVKHETVGQSFVVPPDTSSDQRPVDSSTPADSAVPALASGQFLSPIPNGLKSPQSGEGIPVGEGRALEMDIVSHDVRKFFGLLLKKNGYVLEQLFSPLIVHTTPWHAELKAICCSEQFDTSGNPLTPSLSPSDGERVAEGRVRGGSGVVTKHHSHHYFGFAETQWKLFLKESPRRVKPLLYVYRVLLTGIHLMRTGEVEANLVTLNKTFRLPYIAALIERKTKGESTKMSDADTTFHESEYERLRGELQSAHEASPLPESPSEETRAALNDLLVRVRLSHSSR